MDSTARFLLNHHFTDLIYPRSPHADKFCIFEHRNEYKICLHDAYDDLKYHDIWSIK